MHPIPTEATLVSLSIALNSPRNHKTGRVSRARLGRKRKRAPMFHNTYQAGFLSILYSIG